MFEGLKPPSVGRGAPGMFTGVELPKSPADAKPTEIELDTVGDSTSSSLSSDVRFRSSKCSSSNALPVKFKFVIGIGRFTNDSILAIKTFLYAFQTKTTTKVRNIPLLIVLFGIFHVLFN